jgi:outer membrane protein assembly factor BamB
MNGTVYAYDAKSGALRWHYPVNSWLLGDPVIVNGTVYFGSFDQNVYALRASDGSVQWSYKTKGQIRDTPVVSDGVIYIDQQGTSMGDNAATGTPMTTNAGVLYVLADDGLYGVNANNGAVLWHIASSLLAVIAF